MMLIFDPMFKLMKGLACTYSILELIYFTKVTLIIVFITEISNDKGISVLVGQK